MSNPWIFMGVDRAHFFGEVAVHTDEMLASLNQHFGTDKLTHTRGLELQNSCDDTIITDRWLHFECNLMQKETEYSHF